MRLVQVVWLDAHAVTCGWTDADDIVDVGFAVRSVGWELSGHEGYTVLAQSMSEDVQVDHVLAIPNGMIVRVDQLAVL